MKDPRYLLLAAGSAICLLIFWLVARWFHLQGQDLWVPLILSAIVLAAISTFLASRLKQKAVAAAGSKGSQDKTEELAETDEIDRVLQEAESILKQATVTCPMVLLIGQPESGKTSVIINSALEPQHLAGQLYEGEEIASTRFANIWVTGKTILLEAGGSLLADPSLWSRLTRRLGSGQSRAALSKEPQAPRAAVICVDASKFLEGGDPKPMMAAAQNFRTRLREVSEALGVDLPTYVLFTHLDGLLHFPEYAAHLGAEEVRTPFGVTLPIAGRTPVTTWEDWQIKRIVTGFEELFLELAEKRPRLLSASVEAKQGNESKIYEFPREFRRLADSAPILQFLISVCRPYQRKTAPFLRGFYFIGVRKVVDAPAPRERVLEQSKVVDYRATTVISVGGGAQESPPEAVPDADPTLKQRDEWVFLKRLFNEVMLLDGVAMITSSASVKISFWRNFALASTAILFSILSIFFFISYLANHSLERRILATPQGDSSVNTLASVDSLRRLEVLRQTLETLAKYNREGAPWYYHWGLYIGNDLYPDVRKAYFTNFQRLLLAPTQATIVGSLSGLPAAPGPAYGPTYDNLKAYLITTSNHEKSTLSFLPPTLLSRWSANQDVHADRLQLAQKQFEFYSHELKNANPFSNDNDPAVIGKAREYLSQFAGFERVYQAMLTDAAKTGPAINYNKRFPGSAVEVINAKDVASPFTKAGWDFMKGALRTPEKYFAGEPWVLGERAGGYLDHSKLGQQLTDRYYSEFLNAWRAYIKAASVVRYPTLLDAAKKLEVISGNQSPLLALFWLASQNTAVDLADITNAFQAVHTVVPPANVDRYIAPANQGYMTALVTLQASVDTVAHQSTKNDAAIAQALSSAASAKLAARQMAQAFRIDPDAHIEVVVQKLLEDPITSVEALLRTESPSELNRRGKTLCGIYRPLLNKYPFTSTSAVQATIADLNAIFRKPDGTFWKFYDDNLQKLLPKKGSQYVAETVDGVTLTPGFVTFFNQVAAFSDALYAGGTSDPHFSYTLKPVPSDGIQKVELRLDGQPFSYSYSGGEPTSKKFVWQAAGTHEAEGVVHLGPGAELEWSSYDGLWAVFQFFNQAETWQPSGSGNILEWLGRIGKSSPRLARGKPLTVRFELDMNGSPQFFQKGYFSRLACVAELAK